ncbi:MAG: hypothetical protein ACFFFG_16420 [Candidatus Thorarchaeota archaeon]
MIFGEPGGPVLFGERDIKPSNTAPFTVGTTENAFHNVNFTIMKSLDSAYDLRAKILFDFQFSTSHSSITFNLSFFELGRTESHMEIYSRLGQLTGGRYVYNNYVTGVSGDGTGMVHEIEVTSWFLDSDFPHTSGGELIIWRLVAYDVDNVILSTDHIVTTARLPTMVNAYSTIIPNIRPPENTPPLTILSPNGGETLNGTVTVEWMASLDYFSHSTAYTLYYSSDEGTTWTELTNSVTTISYSWNTSMVSNGFSYLIKAVATSSEGVLMEDVSDSPFTINNETSTPTFSISPGMTGFILISALGTIIALGKRREA